MPRLRNIFKPNISLRLPLSGIAAICVWLAVFSWSVRAQKLGIDSVQKLGGRVILDNSWAEDARPWPQSYVLPLPAGIARLVDPGYYSSVRVIEFWGEPISNDDLSILNRFADLKWLDIADHSITDRGLRHLAELDELEKLRCSGTQISGSGLQHLKNLRQLKGIAIQTTPLTDEGLRYINQIESLEWLDLSETKITGEGLRMLASMKNLKEVQLYSTAVSSEARTWLKQQLPELEITGK